MYEVISFTDYGFRSMAGGNPPPMVVATRTTERGARRLAERLRKLSGSSPTVYTVRRAP